MFAIRTREPGRELLCNHRLAACHPRACFKHYLASVEPLEKNKGRNKTLGSEIRFFSILQTSYEWKKNVMDYLLLIAFGRLNNALHMNVV